jgi:signal transduction histidine kinase
VRLTRPHVPQPPERPLDPLPTLKLKLAAVIFASVSVTVVVFWSLVKLGIWPGPAGIVAAGCALVMVRFLARGMTSPLREMVAASKAMARGEYDRRVTATSQDEIGELARAFNAMAEQLALDDRLRRDLVANVSHELRTPIAALRVKLENMLDGVEPADPETLQIMLAQVERLGRLVGQLLDLSRLESGNVPLDRRSFEVEPMLRLAVREIELRDLDVALDVEVEPVGLVVDADSERLHQVVANLVENAVRYSPRGGTVAVHVEQVGTGVTLTVDDDGPGIPSGQAQHVFERFYRADAARSSRDGGAGLGLAIAQWIVELHGGHIHAETRTPHGCRMVVELPGAARAGARPTVPAT